MICKQHLSNNSFLFVFTLILCIACQGPSGRTKALHALEDVLGKQWVVGPDSIWQTNRPKIITILVDTGTCTSCSMQLRDWYHYKIALENENLACDIVYVLSDSTSIDPAVAGLLKTYGLQAVKGAEALIRQNGLSGNPLRTFLVDSSRTVRLAGSPLYNGPLWKLYKKMLQDGAVKSD